MDVMLRDRNQESFFYKYWHLIALGLIAFFSFWMYFYNISEIGYGNAYYAAAIKSMTQSARNFFYVSFDPAGVVSVDKPPLGLWAQVLFVKIFGYSGWAMLLPQALAGTGSTVMMYMLAVKRFGRPAGLISALVFALTPAVAVASRNNTMDMQLVFVLLLSVWFLFRAIETSRWRWLFLCAVMIGIGFNVKMLQAYMILPAVAVAYFVFSKEKFVKRLMAAAISLLILGGVSFAWVLAVDITHPDARPYVGSTKNNSELELVIGHNGTERLFGQGGLFGRGQRNSQNQALQQGPGNNAQPFLFQFQQGQAQGPQQNQNANSSMQQRIFGPMGPPGNRTQTFTRGAGDGVGNDIGTSGVFRLWAPALYGQASWLFILAGFCIAARIKKFDRKNLNPRQGAFVFWIVWFACMFCFFSFADFWHRYYLCMFAPGIAGLAGPGMAEMARAFKERRGWKQFLLPACLVSTLAFEAVYVWSFQDLRAWLVPVMVAAGAGALALMAFHYKKPVRRLLYAAVCLLFAALLAAPLYWSLTVMLYPAQNSTMPYAGPELKSTDLVPGMTPNQENLTTGDSGTIALEKYLVAHYKNGTYLVISQRANDVAQFIVDTGLPAVAFGGFLGTDNAITLDELKQLVQAGKATYFWIAGGNASEVNSYVKENATLIAPGEYLAQGDTVGQSGGSLYLFE